MRLFGPSGIATFTGLRSAFANNRTFYDQRGNPVKPAFILPGVRVTLVARGKPKRTPLGTVRLGKNTTHIDAESSCELTLTI